MVDWFLSVVCHELVCYCFLLGTTLTAPTHPPFVLERGLIRVDWEVVLMRLTDHGYEVSALDWAVL